MGFEPAHRGRPDDGATRNPRVGGSRNDPSTDKIASLALSILPRIPMMENNFGFTLGHAELVALIEHHLGILEPPAAKLADGAGRPVPRRGGRTRSPAQISGVQGHPEDVAQPLSFEQEQEQAVVHIEHQSIVHCRGVVRRRDARVRSH
jgi:hypothetical protein